MGSITITVDAGAGGTATRTFTVSNANLLRLVTWIKAISPNGGALTNPQAMERWMQWIIDQSRAQVLDDERRKRSIPDFDVS